MSFSTQRLVAPRLLLGTSLMATILLSPMPTTHSAPADPVRADDAKLPSLIPNGDLETDANGDGWPDGWEHPDGASWEKETVNGKDNHFLRLKQTAPGNFVHIYNAVPIPAEDTQLDLHFRYRTSNIQNGKENYNDARFIFHFKDAGRGDVNPDPGSVDLPANSDGWAEQDLKFTVPKGTSFMEILPSLFNVQSGTMDFDDMRLVVSQAPKPAPVPPEPTAYIPPPELKASGNQIKTVDGQVMVLRGVNVPSLDWMPEGDHVLQSVRVAVGDWKSKIIRLPVNDEFWFGRGPRQSDGGAAYRALVDECIRAAARRGSYVILDLHDYGATQAKQLPFWDAVAGLYKNNPAVLFDILNEPHDISWKVWRDGGTIEKEAAKDGKPAVTYQSPGMQGVVSFIRRKGARNIIVAGGLDWAYDLTGVLNGYALSDKTGNGIVYSTHIYSWKKDWANKVVAVSQKYPVFIGEFGADDIRLPSVPAAQQEDPYVWVPEILGFAQKNNLGWTAWSFHTDATPRLLANWDYQPTPFYGGFVKSALLGGRFEMTRMR